MRHYEDLRLADTEAAVAQVPDLAAVLDDAKDGKKAAELGSNLATGTEGTPRKRKRRRPQVMQTTPLVDGTPAGVRTPNLLIRSQVLYPVELRAPVCEPEIVAGAGPGSRDAAASGAFDETGPDLTYRRSYALRIDRFEEEAKPIRAGDTGSTAIQRVEVSDVEGRVKTAVTGFLEIDDSGGYP